MDKLLNGIVGVALGIYVVKVAINGNSKELFSYLKDERKYLEFLIALYALWLLHKYGPFKDITSYITVAAITAIAIKVASNSNFGQALDQFAKGEKSLLETAQSIFGN